MINVEDHFNLVRYVLNRYFHKTQRDYDYEDLFQEGCIGLYKAAKSFDESKNVKFSTFAVIQIKGYIRQGLLRESSLYAGRKDRIDAYKIKAVMNKEGDPEIDKVAKLTGLSQKRIEDLEPLYVPKASLDFNITMDQPAGKAITHLSDVLISDEDIENNFIQKEMIEEFFREKGSFVKKIFIMKFIDDMTQQEIADELGVSQSVVSRAIISFSKEHKKQNYKSPKFDIFCKMYAEGCSKEDIIREAKITENTYKTYKHKYKEKEGESIG